MKQIITVNYILYYSKLYVLYIILIFHEPVSKADTVIDVRAMVIKLSHTPKNIHGIIANFAATD